MGRESTLDFFLPQAWAMTMELQLSPFLSPSTPAQRITVEINNAPRGPDRVAARVGVAVYSLALPASACGSGINVLRFTYAYTATPAHHPRQQGDARDLAVAFSRIVLRRQYAN